MQYLQIALLLSFVSQPCHLTFNYRSEINIMDTAFVRV